MALRAKKLSGAFEKRAPDLFDLLEVPSRLMFAIRLKGEELAFGLMLELGLPYTEHFSVNIRLITEFG